MLYEAFKRNREERPNSPAFLVTSGDRSLPISWRQFTDDIAVVAYIVKSHAPGGTIGLLGENSYEWLVAHAAVVFAGATVVPIDVNLNADEIASRLKFVGAGVLIYSSLYNDKAHTVKRLMPGLLAGGFGSRKTDIFLDVARAAMHFGRNSIWDTGVTYAETSMIFFTSGTTSTPRGAELTVAGIEAHITSWSEVLAMKEGNRSLMLLPLHHIFGLCATYLLLCRGIALGVCPDFRRIYDAVQRFRVSYLFLVPALADILGQKIANRADSAEQALGMPIDWVVVGGASLSRYTYERLVGLGIRTMTAYGLTETTAVYSIAPSEGDPHVGSAGKVVCSAAAETKVSEQGELLIRGPAVMRGYFRSPEQTAQVLQDGWFHTGDYGRIDEDGFVWITGRISRTIVLSSGKKIAPEELEEKLLGIPGIREAVVMGDTASREIKAEVYGTISQASVDRAVGELNLTLPVYKRLRKVIARKEPFPRTSSGKIKVS